MYLLVNTRTKQFGWSVLLMVMLNACNLFQAGPPAPPPPPPPPPPPQNLPQRPAGSPDVVILSVSGRCGTSCSPPRDNYDYLLSSGADEAIASTLREMGLSVEFYGYSAKLETSFSSISGRTEPGFLEMETRLNYVRDTLITGFSNPTRIVVVGHSHGVVWTHNLVRAHPEIRVSYLIDFDGICSLWEIDNRADFDRFYAGHTNPWNLDLSHSCGVVPVAGGPLADVRDIAFPNVLLNLEVQSNHYTQTWRGPVNFVFDSTNNMRVDGSRTGIETWQATDQDHMGVVYPGSAWRWVQEQIRTHGLPL